MYMLQSRPWWPLLLAPQRLSQEFSALWGSLDGDTMSIMHSKGLSDRSVCIYIDKYKEKGLEMNHMHSPLLSSSITSRSLNSLK